MSDDFDARAKRDDYGTSHEAARAMRGKPVNAAARACLQAIAEAGEYGANCSEVCARMKLRWQTASPRWVGLRMRGLIESRDEFVPVIINGSPTVTRRMIKRPGASGKNQIVWFATMAGRAYAAVMDPVKVIDGKAHDVEIGGP